MTQARAHSEAGASGPPPARPRDLLRTALALGAILPGLLAGAWSWLRHRDRRRAVNRSYAVWARLGPAAAGIELAIQGARHLERPRPAVFVINHQSGVDAMLVCALLRRDFAGVAKQELRRNPLLGPAMAFVGTIFLDRFDPARSHAQLAPAVEALHGGVSIALAPEGTRSRDGRLGRFKLGALHIAAAAGAPIVPIVFENSRDVLPPGAWLMRPARVRVQVLEPVETRDWKREELEAQRRALEASFTRVLDAVSEPG